MVPMMMLMKKVKTKRRRRRHMLTCSSGLGTASTKLPSIVQVTCRYRVADELQSPRWMWRRAIPTIGQVGVGWSHVVGGGGVRDERAVGNESNNREVLSGSAPTDSALGKPGQCERGCAVNGAVRVARVSPAWQIKHVIVLDHISREEGGNPMVCCSSIRVR
jgi:hypothetical protein